MPIEIPQNVIITGIIIARIYAFVKVWAPPFSKKDS